MGLLRGGETDVSRLGVVGGVLARMKASCRLGVQGYLVYDKKTQLKNADRIRPLRFLKLEPEC